MKKTPDFLTENNDLLVIKSEKKGPSINVNLFLKNGILERVSVNLSPKGFSCFANEIPSKSMVSWLENYLNRTSLPFEGLLNLNFPSYTRQVLKYVSKIPFGSTVSYADVAESLGNRRGARAVGGACGKNPYLLFIPCHRVIAAHGNIGGFAIDKNIKKELLLFENSNN